MCIVFFPFVLKYTVIGDTNSWIGFWGAYAGAIGTVFMALVAVETLKTNEEQLEIIRQQNRPLLFSSIFILHERDHERHQNIETFILRVENHGSQIAKNVNIAIDVSDTSLLNNSAFKTNIESIEKSIFSLPAKVKQDFIITNALPIIKQEKEGNAKRNNYDQQWNFIDKVKSSIFKITLKCDGYEDEVSCIKLSSVGYLPTNNAQILSTINHTLEDLTAKINRIYDDKT